MTISTWSVAQMKAYPERDGKTNVVFTVHWRLTGTDGFYSAGIYGSVGVTVDPDAPFTPYEDLTEDQVIGWVKNALGDEQVSAYEANIVEHIFELANPSVVNLPAPWSA